MYDKLLLAKLRSELTVPVFAILTAITFVLRYFWLCKSFLEHTSVRLTACAFLSTVQVKGEGVRLIVCSSFLFCRRRLETLVSALRVRNFTATMMPFADYSRVQKKWLMKGRSTAVELSLCNIWWIGEISLRRESIHSFRLFQGFFLLPFVEVFLQKRERLWIARLGCWRHRHLN